MCSLVNFVLTKTPPRAHLHQTELLPRDSVSKGLPRLPRELERLIFEMVLKEMGRGDGLFLRNIEATNLLLVAQRVHIW